MTLPRVLVISLASSVQRRAVIGRRLDELGLDYEFFDGVDGRALDLSALPDYDGRRRRLFFGKDLTPGEVGCLLSHRAVYRRVAHENAPVLVLEDDAILSDDVPVVLSAIMKQEKTWDVVRFLDSEKTLKKKKIIADLGGGYALAKVYGTPGGAYATLLSAKAAARLASLMIRNWQPGDILLGQSWRTGLKVLAVAPSPISADDVVPSTIGAVRFEKTKALQGWEKTAYPATRMAYKLWQAAGKTWDWL
jgi:glycosyl transferase, family 25